MFAKLSYTANERGEGSVIIEQPNLKSYFTAIMLSSFADLYISCIERKRER